MPECCEQLFDDGQDALLNMEARPKDLFDLAKKLKGCQAFSLARRLLCRVQEYNPSPEVVDPLLLKQQLALCTYKDPDLSSEDRLQTALEILDGVLSEALAFCEKSPQDRNEAGGTANHQETLSLAGAIYKRKWQIDGLRKNLMISADYYRRAYELGAKEHVGYAGVNAAFVNDLLARLVAADSNRNEARSRLSPASDVYIGALSTEAKEIRKTVISRLTINDRGKPVSEDYWTLVTIAEAYFGLRDYAKAGEWLEKAQLKVAVPTENDPVQRWQLETTARQLVELAALDENAAGTEAAQAALARFIGQTAVEALASARGAKVGLALSGGGFRASLYHIGVLAGLAERDLLRHVEVLSCVSGGSIIGALYYLKVRNLLESKSESRISRDDYVEIVQAIERDFLRFVQGNPRMKSFTRPDYFLGRIIDWLRCRKSPRPPFGKLLDGELYGPALAANQRKQKRRPGGDDYLQDLIIQPQCEAEGFQPKYENWRRKAKVPILILNATTLNTGHNWQFACTWMGESPAEIDPQIDANDRLRRAYYEECKPPFDEVRLGTAVAASACVPGIFAPIKLAGFYPGYTVRLVDGGVYDNQGVGSLLEQDCTVLLVSDASGQNVTEKDAPLLPLKVLMRSGNVQGGRVRAEEYERLQHLRRASVLRGFAFVHLKKELGTTPIDWEGCSERKNGQVEGGLAINDTTRTSYGIRTDLQNSLSAIRTDLDAFSDLEALGLMVSGYRMIEKELDQLATDVPTLCAAPKTEKWGFLQAEPLLRDTSPNPQVKLALDVGKERFGKFLRMSRAWRVLVNWVRPLLTACFVLLALGLCVLCWWIPVLVIRPIVVVLVILAIAAGIAAFVFAGPVYLMSRVFDRIYLARGRFGLSDPHGDPQGGRPWSRTGGETSGGDD